MMQKSTMQHDQQSEHNYSESRSPSPFGNESSSFKDMFEVSVNQYNQTKYNKVSFQQKLYSQIFIEVN